MATKTFKIGLSNTDKQNMAQDVYERLLALTFPEYDSAESYNVGDFVVYNDQLYKCIGATSGAWDSTKWQLATLNDLLTDIEDAVAFVNDKANVDGNYPTMTVGLAGNLDTKIVDNDVNAYNYRPTGGLDTESGNNCKEKTIVGGSLGFNQLIKLTNSTSTESGVSITKDDYSIELNGTFDGTNAFITLSNQHNISLVNGHKYLIGFPNGASDKYGIGLIYGSSYPFSGFKSSVFSSNVSGNVNLMLIFRSTTYTYNNEKIYFALFDLTAMFGSTIADYIYSLEQGTAGAGVAWFKRYFNKPYYPYTPIGGFTNVITRGKKAVGFNQLKTTPTHYSNGISPFNTDVYSKVLGGNSYRFEFDSIGSATSWRIAFRLYDLDGNLITDTNAFTVTSGYQYLSWNESLQAFLDSDNETSKYKEITFNQDCYVAFYFGLGTTTASIVMKDACLHFTYDHERDGEYEEYREEIYENDPIELIGIPQKDDQGNLYFDGNRYNADGSVDEKYAVVDLGSLEYTEASSGLYFTIGLSSLIKTPADNHAGHQITALLVGNGKYTITYLDNMPQRSGNYISVSSAGRVYIEDHDYDGATSLKNALNGVYLVYPKATPTQSSATSYPETQWIDNWGTEERLPPSNDTRPCEIPVGHDTDYPLDLKSKLEIMPNSPSADGDYVLHSASGVNTYVALGSWLSNNGWVKLTDISGYDATKTQTLKNVEGTLTWVDDE